MFEIEDFAANAVFRVNSICNSVISASYKGLEIRLDSNNNIFQISNPTHNKDLSEELGKQKLPVLLVSLMYSWGWQEACAPLPSTMAMIHSVEATNDILRLLLTLPENKIAFSRGHNEAKIAA